MINVVRGPHSNEFLDELTAFPHGAHDDCIDALAGAYDHLSNRGGTLTVHRPRGRIPIDSGVTRLRGRVYGSDPIAEVAAQLGARIYPSRPA